MFWYIILLSLFISIVYLIFGGESSNNGGDASLFIKAEDPNKVKTVKKNKFDIKTANIYDKPGKQILILYGTAYGFAERLAKKLYIKLKHDNIQPRLVNMASCNDYIDLQQETTILLLVSTAGDGVPPSDARPFVDYILHNISYKLSHIHYATLALGDSNYPQFCAAGKLINNRFNELQAKTIMPIQLIDKEDFNSIDQWFDNIHNLIHNNNDYIPIKQDYLAGRQQQTLSTYNRNNPYNATIVNKYLLTKIGQKDDKEIIHVDIDISGSDITYTEGDAIGIIPYNNPTEVKLLLNIINKTGKENVTVEGYDTVNNLYDALLQCYDLRVIQNTLMQLLIDNTSDKTIKQQLTDGINNREQFILNKEVIEILQEYNTTAAKLNIQSLVDNLRPLQPRYYSISSSPLVYNNVVSVTAGVIRYELPAGRSGTGVCTTYLADRLNVNDKVNVFISQNHDFRLPDDSSKPIIMIGPGTGLAPFRAFIQNRVHNNATGTNLLYFGCRYSTRDYTYRTELEQWVKDNKLELRLAFSRDQANKVYVQNLLLQDSEYVYDLVHNQGAHIYICGDGANMAKDVHNVLIDILCKYKNVNNQQAEEYLNNLAKQNRYQKDVWIT